MAVLCCSVFELRHRGQMEPSSSSGPNGDGSFWKAIMMGGASDSTEKKRPATTHPGPVMAKKKTQPSRPPTSQPWLQALRNAMDKELEQTGSSLRPVKLASACTGLASEAKALSSLGIDFTYLYGSDPSPASVSFVQANAHKPEHFFDDLRAPRQGGGLCKWHGTHCCITQKEDIFVAGFPCQPYSHARGNHHSVSAEDHPDRRVATDVMQHIKQFTPRFVILENVASIREHKPVFNEVQNKLRAAGYSFNMLELDAATFVPMRRCRIFFVGVHSTVPGGAPAVLNRIMQFIYRFLMSDIEVQSVEDILLKPTDPRITALRKASPPWTPQK